MAEPNNTPQPTRQYLLTEGQVRLLFVGSAVAVIALTVGILFLAFARPQGRAEAADGSQFALTLQQATETLQGYELLENGRARIDIERAMELVAERGVAATVVNAGGVAADAGATGGEAGDPGAQGAALPDGETIYEGCVGCHQPAGTGIPAAFPPLAGHAPELLAGDRDYLPQVLLYGLQGQIRVSGLTYNGLMPAWPQLGDDDIAAVLNYLLTAWGNDQALPDDFEPYSPAEVAALRGKGLTGPDILELRNQLGLP